MLSKRSQSWKHSWCMIPFTVNLRQTNYSLGIGNYKASKEVICNSQKRERTWEGLWNYWQDSISGSEWRYMWVYFVINSLGHIFLFYTFRICFFSNCIFRNLINLVITIFSGSVLKFRYNWHITLYLFQVYKIMIRYYVYIVKWLP